MTPQEYYKSVFKQLQKCFSGFHYVIAAGRDLLADGWDPKLLVAVESVDQLEKFTCKKGMQVHLPIIGEKSSFVLMPLDFEIFLTGENHLLYTDIQASKYWLAKSVKYSRNYLYAGLAITTIAVTGRNFAMIGPCSSKIVATLGIGLAAFSAKDLYDATSFLQSAVNIKRQPLETAIGRN